MPLYVCMRDKPQKGDLLPCLVRDVPCGDSGSAERTLLTLWVGSPPHFQNFESAFYKEWQNPRHEKDIREVISSIDRLNEPERGTDDQLVYMAFGEGLIAFMEGLKRDPDPLLCDEFAESHRALYGKVRCKLELERTEARDESVLRFQMKDSTEMLEVPIIACEEESRLPAEYRRTLKELSKDNADLKLLGLVTRRFLDFATGVKAHSDKATHLCAFAEALLDFAEETRGSLLADIQSVAGLRPGIYEFIIMNESSVERRKAYLEKFVAEEEDYATEKGVFYNIMRGLKRDQVDPGFVQETGLFVVEYYLRVYDLVNAARVLEAIAADSSSRQGSRISVFLMKVASSLYTKTSRWAAWFGVFLLALMSPALLEPCPVPKSSPLHQLVPVYQEGRTAVTLFVTTS